MKKYNNHQGGDEERTDHQSEQLNQNHLNNQEVNINDDRLSNNELNSSLKPLQLNLGNLYQKDEETQRHFYEEPQQSNDNNCREKNAQRETLDRLRFGVKRTPLLADDSPADDEASTIFVKRNQKSTVSAKKLIDEMSSYIKKQESSLEQEDVRKRQIVINAKTQAQPKQSVYLNQMEDFKESEINNKLQKMSENPLDASLNIKIIGQQQQYAGEIQGFQTPYNITSFYHSKHQMIDHPQKTSFIDNSGNNYADRFSSHSSSNSNNPRIQLNKNGSFNSQTNRMNAAPNDNSRIVGCFTRKETRNEFSNGSLRKSQIGTGINTTPYNRQEIQASAECGGFGRTLSSHHGQLKQEREESERNIKSSEKPQVFQTPTDIGGPRGIRYNFERHEEHKISRSSSSLEI